jgi:hypothetical protein
LRSFIIFVFFSLLLFFDSCFDFNKNVFSANENASFIDVATIKLSKKMPALVVQTSTAIPAIGAKVFAGAGSLKKFGFLICFAFQIPIFFILFLIFVLKFLLVFIIFTIYLLIIL